MYSKEFGINFGQGRSRLAIGRMFKTSCQSQSQSRLIAVEWVLLRFLLLWSLTVTSSVFYLCSLDLMLACKPMAFGSGVSSMDVLYSKREHPFRYSAMDWADRLMEILQSRNMWMYGQEG